MDDVELLQVEKQLRADAQNSHCESHIHMHRRDNSIKRTKYAMNFCFLCFGGALGAAVFNKPRLLSMASQAMTGTALYAIGEDIYMHRKDAVQIKYFEQSVEFHNLAKKLHDIRMMPEDDIREQKITEWWREWKKVDKLPIEICNVSYD